MKNWKKRFKSGLSILLAATMIANSGVIAFAETSENVDISNGLIAHYDFETVTDTTVTNIVDADTFAGTISGSATTSNEDGTLGYSMKLGSAAGGMQLTDIIDASTSSFSISLWYKASATSGSNVNLVQAGEIGGSTGRTILILDPNSKYQTYLTGDNAKVPTTTAVTPTQWQQVIFAYDQANSKAYFYVNGVVDNAEGLSLSGTALSTDDMIIGRHRNANEGQFNGLIDEVRVYNKVVSAEEAKAIYDNKATEIYAGTLNALITEAQSLYDSAADKASATAIALNTALTNAIAVRDAATKTLEEMTNAYNALEAAMDAFNDTLPGTPITLTIDADDLERTIDSDSIFGINHRYAFNGYGSFDPTTMKVKDDFKELYEEAGFGSIRYPGGTISNLFNWKATLGPVEARKNQIHGFYNNSGQGGIAPNFGIGEIATFADEVDSEIVYVYSLGRGNAQDAADLIEYLNAKVGTNPNGGIDWAAVRAENGHPAPYNVRYFEIGNEMQQAWAGSDGTASQGYWTTSVPSGSETAYIDGGVATFTQQYAVCEEDWNQVASRSDGSANMVRYMRYANVNPKMYDENGDIVDDPNFVAVVKDSVHVYVGSTEWTIVESFENSSASAQHVVIDYSTGAIHFGDGVHGAIPASGTQINVSYSVDRDGFIDVSKAMKETTDAINEAEGTTYEAYVYSSYETEGYISKMAARNANEWYDGLTIHPYSGTPSGSGEAFYDSAMSLAESAGIQKVQNYVNMLPEGKVPVISEYGIFRSTDTQLRAQTHAVYIAKVLMEYVRLGSPYIQKHCLIDWYSSGADSLGPTQQAVIQAVAGNGANTTTGEGPFTFFSTPSAHVFQMLNTGFGDYILSSEFSSTPTMSNGVKTISALASKDNDGNIYVAIVNVNREDAYSVTLNLENVVPEEVSVNAQLLSTDSYTTANTPENPDNVTVSTSGFTASTDSLTYTVPKHSFAILKIASATQPTVDKTELAKAIAAADVLVAENFTEETWAPFVAALDAAKAVNTNDDATYSEVETALANLKTTVNNLVAGPNANKTKLASLLEECEGLDADAYTEETWTTFVAALDSAKAINEDTAASQGEVNGAVITLKAAKEALVEKGSDPTDDSNDIDVSKITYTAGSTQASTGVSYEGGINLAYDNNPSTHWHSEWNPTWYGTDNCADHLWVQFDLDEPTVVDAIRYLPRSTGSRNGDITSYRVEAKTSENGEWATLTEGTWASDGQEWKLARFDATEVVSLRLVATSTFGDSAVNKFASAAELRVRAVKESLDDKPVVTPFNKTALAEAIAAAEKLSANDYTPDSWTVFSAAIVAARVVYTNESATETDIITALADLAAAQDALVRKPAKPVNSFEDVFEVDYYYDPVTWAVENNITDGWTPTLFAPEMGCTRGQVVTFLWRAAGEPKVKNAENPFHDVTGDTYYYDAVLWAVENGITDGWTDTSFAPEMTCTRGQIVTFIWRAAGKPTAEDAENPFTDVAENAYYYDAVLWAVENGITDGWTDTSFAPEMTCTRGQIVTFLYRYYNPTK